MIQILFSPYKLTPVRAGVSPRLGCLLKVVYHDKKEGYADLHPWPEFGDKTLSEEILDLTKGIISPLAEQSLWMARRDAEARFVRKNLLKDRTKLKNHYLVLDVDELKEEKLVQLKQQGFSALKIKIGRDPERDGKVIEKILKQHNFIVRLDANAKLSFDQFERFFPI